MAISGPNMELMAENEYVSGNLGAWACAASMNTHAAAWKRSFNAIPPETAPGWDRPGAQTLKHETHVGLDDARQALLAGYRAEGLVPWIHVGRIEVGVVDGIQHVHTQLRLQPVLRSDVEVAQDPEVKVLDAVRAQRSDAAGEHPNVEVAGPFGAVLLERDVGIEPPVDVALVHRSAKRVLQHADVPVVELVAPVDGRSGLFLEDRAELPPADYVPEDALLQQRLTGTEGKLVN